MSNSKFQINKLSFPNDSERWQNLLNTNVYASYLHSEYYLQTKKSNNSTFESYIISNETDDLGGAHFITKLSKYGILKIGNIRTGLISNTNDVALYCELIDLYLKWAKEKNCSYLTINPWLPSKIDGQDYSPSLEIKKYLISNGFRPIASPKHTYWLDLNQPSETLLKNMNKGTRYRINLGLRSDIEVKIYTKASDSKIDEFWHNYTQIGERKQFNTYKEYKFKNEVRELVNNDLASMVVLEYQDIPINFSLVSHGNVAFYMHGAINIEYKNLDGCPSPGQLAQWKMIELAKKLGSKIYDMGFCPGPVPDKSHMRYNIWNFKYEFGGIPVEYMPVYGKITSPIKGRIYKLLRKE